MGARNAAVLNIRISERGRGSADFNCEGYLRKFNGEVEAVEIRESIHSAEDFLKCIRFLIDEYESRAVEVTLNKTSTDDVLLDLLKRGLRPGYIDG